MRKEVQWLQMRKNSCKKILIVEDSRVSTQITADILSRYGYCVEMVCTGEEAIEKVKKENDIDSDSYGY